MKLRLFFIIAVSTMCGGFAVEMRGMEGGLAKSTLQTNALFSEKILKASIAETKKNATAFSTALQALGKAEGDYAYAEELFTATLSAPDNKYLMSRILTVLSDADRSLSTKKAALFFLTAFLGTDAKTHNALTEQLSRTAGMSDENWKQLIACYEKILEYADGDTHYFVINSIRTTIMGGTYNNKIRPLLRKSFAQMGDITELKKIFDEQVMLYDDKNREMGFRKESAYYLKALEEAFLKKPSLQLDSKFFDCDLIALKNSLENALEEQPEWAIAILRHTQGRKALTMLLKEDKEVVWQLLIRLSDNQRTEVISIIKDLGDTFSGVVLQKEKTFTDLEKALYRKQKSPKSSKKVHVNGNVSERLFDQNTSIADAHKNLLRNVTEEKSCTINFQATTRISPLEKLDLAKAENISVELPERAQATIGNGIHISYKSTSWQPAIFKTALVAGLGAACWWQWNAVKTLTTRTIPDSLYALFARVQRGSA
jgi:tetratricopeptide (TPR) repeat protein